MHLLLSFFTWSILPPLLLPRPVQRIKAHPEVEADIARVALQRRPLIYCLETVDNGGHVRNLAIPPDVPLSTQHRPELLGGLTVIQGPAMAVYRSGFGGVRPSPGAATWDATRLAPEHTVVAAPGDGRTPTLTRYVDREPWPDQLYLPSSQRHGVTPTRFTAIPYFANANRQPGEMMVWMAESADKATPIPLPTPATRAKPSASHGWQTDTVSALNDQVEPAASDDTTIPGFTWWNHRGSSEWVQYDFDHPTKVCAAEVYWWDERRIHAHCRVPQSWRLLYQSNGAWKPVTGASAYGTGMDRCNRITFDPVATSALRLEVQLQADWSGGVLEWRVE